MKIHVFQCFHEKIEKVYYRERICFHQLLAATRITKPLTLGARTPFNQAGNFGHARPFQSARQKFISTLQLKVPAPPYMAWGLLFLPAPTAGPPSPFIPRHHRHTPLHPPGAWWPRCAASGLSVDIWRQTTQAVTLKS
jgi:hypothetical protein